MFHVVESSASISLISLIFSALVLFQTTFSSMTGTTFGLASLIVKV